MFHKCLLSVAVMVAVLATAGCLYELKQGAYFDSKTDQPWVGPGRRAEGVISTKTTEMDTVKWLEWRMPEGTYRDSRAIAKEAESYLKARGQWEAWAERLDYGDQRVIAVKKALVIVAVEPTIVLVTPGETTYFVHEMASYFTYPPEPVRRADGTYEMPIKLIRGFQYGTTVPYTTDPVWFSPDLDQGPARVPINANGDGVIDVPWGHLIMTRDNDVWRIKAVD